jgi:hypothetical protein
MFWVEEVHPAEDIDEEYAEFYGQDRDSLIAAYAAVNTWLKERGGAWRDSA